MAHTNELLLKMLEDIKKSPSQYYMFSGQYCEEMDCENPDCEEHYGSVLGGEYRISLVDKEYKSVEVCVTFGGPNIFLDTQDSYLRGYWGNQRQEVPVSYEITEAVDDYWRDMYECGG